MKHKIWTFCCDDGSLPSIAHLYFTSREDARAYARAHLIYDNNGYITKFDYRIVRATLNLHMDQR